MAIIHVTQIFETIDFDGTFFNEVDFVIKHQNRIVGEASVTLVDYCKICETGHRLDTVARFKAEDMHLALSALAKVSPFSNAAPNTSGEAHIIAYISRIYIFPEHRRKGFGAEFVKILPDIIESMTKSAPIAISVYVCPQSKAQSATGTITNLTQKSQKEMRKIMESMFATCGYFHPSKTAAHSRCMCWLQGES